MIACTTVLNLNKVKKYFTIYILKIKVVAFKI